MFQVVSNISRALLYCYRVMRKDKLMEDEAQHILNLAIYWMYQLGLKHRLYSFQEDGLMH